MGEAMVERILDFDSVKDYLNKIDENAYNLLSTWKKHPEITNDEKIADLFKTKVTIVRSTLNKLSYYGIVSYDKVKDKNSGWYDYYWKIDFHKLAKLIYAEHKEKKQKLEQKMDFGQIYDFFNCNNSCKVQPFEVAAEYNFVCPHCNEKLEHYDYNKDVKDMQRYLSTIDKEMSFIKDVLSNNGK